MTEPFPLAPSLWAATATPAPPAPPLEESTSADVCIVGGGFAGLSTALHLAERGIRALVLEAREPGWGASGRNGGQVIPGLKYDPDEIVAMFGAERGQRLIEFAGGTADIVFQLIEKHRMDVPRTRNGWIQGAHTAAAVELVRSRAEQWSRLGAPVQFLDKPAADRLLGTDKYLGGWLDRRGGAIQPLSYARGLAKAALDAGARIHGETPATRLVRAGARWSVQTGRGATVTADRVVICTNGYTGELWPKLRQTAIAVNSYQVATEPLGDNLQRSVLPEGQVLSDTRQLLLYFRRDHQGRLIMGGRGPFREPKGEGDWAHLVRVIQKMFPQLAGVPIAFRWCGRIAVTRDHLPHLHEPAPGLLIDMGCQGRGIGLQTAVGKAMAEYIATSNAAALPLPFTPIEPIPFHALQRLYVGALVAWYRLTDGGLRK
ncbi:MAG TPA: FAD-binding oxidoreductase [Stellaceae bacterium]|jgi:glycine/D-amino acid oxidase-like deaminating enzyme|nr:FAD-binding oxidoreductase [Stellaceae bacterium]